jgi:predicted Zn finger-like uncharacterized protein
VAISVSCGECGADYAVVDDDAGRQFRCRECGHVIVVPPRDSDVGEPSLTRPDDAMDRLRRAAIEALARADAASSEPTISRALLGRISLEMGIGAWVFGVALEVAAAFIAPAVNAPPIAAACGSVVVSSALALMGTFTGILALLNPQASKRAAIFGLVLNVTYLAFAVGLVVLRIARAL